MLFKTKELKDLNTFKRVSKIDTAFIVGLLLHFHRKSKDYGSKLIFQEFLYNLFNKTGELTDLSGFKMGNRIATAFNFCVQYCRIINSYIVTENRNALKENDIF